MSKSPPDIPRRRKWLARRSLQSSIVVTAVVAIGMGWLVNGARMQRESVAAIERDGGKAWYDWEWADGEAVVSDGPRWPDWLVKTLGVDYFGHVVAVHLTQRAGDETLARVASFDRLESLEFSGSHVSAKGFASLGKLEHLRRFSYPRGKGVEGALVLLERMRELKVLRLSGSRLDDAGLAHLRGLTRVEELDLSNNPITDAGLAHLEGMTGLKVLNLGKTRISGDGLIHLRGMTGMEDLILGRTPLTDAGLVHLEGLTAMEDLVLDHTPITGLGLSHLRGMTALKSLDLNHTALNDAGLAHLEGLNQLTALLLDGTNITDAGLPHLQNLNKLGTLSLDSTGATDAGVRALQVALPRTAISY